MAIIEDEDERKNTSFANILKLVAAAAISKSDAGAIAVKEDMDLRDAEAKEYTDKALDYIDRLALPKLLQKRAAASKEKKFAELLINTHGMSPEAVKAISNGGIGELENFYNKKAVELATFNGSPLSGSQLDSIVKNAYKFADDPKDVIKFIKDRHEPMAAIMKQRQGMPEAAIFSSMFGSPKEISNRKLSELPVYGDISALDMVRYAKGGGFEDTTEDEMANYDLEQIDKITSPPRDSRIITGLMPSIPVSFSQDSPVAQASRANTVFQLMLLRNNINFDEADEVGSPIQFTKEEVVVNGVRKIVSTGVIDYDASSPEVQRIIDNFEKERKAFNRLYAAQDADGKRKETQDTATNIVREFKNHVFEDKDAFIRFLSLIDPLKLQVFKYYDTFKVGNGELKVGETGYYTP